MSFFSGSDGDPPDASERESLARIEAGGIPLSAEARLRELTGEAPFTSTLSISEFALMNELGPTSLGQVMGASVHQVGWQYLSSDARWGRTLVCGLDRVEQAWDQARRRAFGRLTEEARLLGADAVIGVKLSRGEHDWARGCVDYVVTGTAIRIPGAEGNRWPGLSDLSVQEYWKLLATGWTPAGLCASTAVYFVSMSLGTRFNQWTTATQNQELGDYSRGFSAARRAAVNSLRSQARSANADGLVGVTLEHQIGEESFKTLPAYGYQTSPLAGRSMVNPEGKEEREGVVITIQAVGTAITRTDATSRPLTTPIVRLQESE